MKPVLFKTPDDLEAFIRSLPVPEGFTPHKVNEMIRHGRAIFEVRQIIAKSLLGNTKSFDKYADILGQYVSTAVDETIGEEVRKLQDRLTVLSDSATRFDGIFDKLFQFVNEASTRSSLVNAKDKAVEVTITGYGSALEELLSKARETNKISKEIEQKWISKSQKSNERVSEEKIKMHRGKDIHQVYEEVIGKPTAYKSMTAVVSKIIEETKILLSLKQGPEELVSSLRRYCDLQVEFNRRHMNPAYYRRSSND